MRMNCSRDLDQVLEGKRGMGVELPLLKDPTLLPSSIKQNASVLGRTLPELVALDILLT